MSDESHNHPEGILADMGDCPRCDGVYWNPRLIKATDPRPEPAIVFILTVLISVIALAVFGVIRLLT